MKTPLFVGALLLTALLPIVAQASHDATCGAPDSSTSVGRITVKLWQPGTCYGATVTVAPEIFHCGGIDQPLLEGTLDVIVLSGDGCETGATSELVA